MTQRKRRVLFVDDDPFIIRSFKRSADEYLDEWDTFCVSSAKDALMILSQHPMDVLITDMRMPVMDGNALLEIVSQRFPGVVRFVLSGNTEDAKIMQTTQLAHQFIAKPCDMEKLKVLVESSCRLRDMLKNPQLIQVVTGIKTLPSLPSLYTRLMKALQSEDPTPKVIGDIIAQDVAMTAKILQLVNSAFFGLRGKVTSPQRAVTILGINTVKSLVLGIHVFSEFQEYDNPAFSIDNLWRHSIQVGNLAKALAANAGLESKIQDEVQVAGVLHDIGKLLQLKIPSFFRQVRIVNGSISLESEYQAFGASHAELGAYLLGIWGLPEPVIEAVAYHHRPVRSLAKKTDIVTVLHIANGLCIMCNAVEAGEYEAYMDMEYLNKINVLTRLDEWSALARKMIYAPSADGTGRGSK